MKKPLKVSSKWSLLVVSIVGIAVSLIVIFFLIRNLLIQSSHAKPSSFFNIETLPVDSPDQDSGEVSISSSTSAQNSTEVESTTPSEAVILKYPLRLRIPKINVNANVESVGLTSKGNMDVPKGPYNAGWYKLGPLPGEIGTSVIDGHYGLGKGTPSVFENLNELRKGDKVYVENEKGEVIVFVVRESRSYDPEADATEVFDSNDGKSHLNLITCEGIWDKVSKSYSKRLVVFMDKE